MKLNEWLFVVLIIAGIGCEKKTSPDTPAQIIQKNDLALMKWIEGNWVGDYNGQPFYETYEMVNDSTFKILNYSNVNTDTASVMHDFIYWSDGSYFMGEGRRYKVVKLDQTEVHMLPVHGNNEILWTHVNDSTWTALLSGSTDTARYTLKKVSPAMDSILLSLKSKVEMRDE